MSRGKDTDWQVHMLGQSAGAYTNATHDMTLSVVSLPYYRYIMPYGLPKFVRFAKEVWGINGDGKTEDMFDGIGDGTIIMEGGYKVLNRDEVLKILKDSV